MILNTCLFCKQLINLKVLSCKNCYDKIKIYKDYFYVYKMKIWAGCNYNHISSQVIFSLKYGSNPLVTKKMAQWIYDNLNIPWNTYDYLIYIPMRWYKYLWRGYNQSYLLTYYLSKLTAIPIVNILKKIDHKSQTQKNYQERINGPQFQFTITLIDSFINKKFLIVDDVITTGSTFFSIYQLFQSNNIFLDGVTFSCNNKFFNKS